MTLYGNVILTKEDIKRFVRSCEIAEKNNTLDGYTVYLQKLSPKGYKLFLGDPRIIKRGNTGIIELGVLNQLLPQIQFKNNNTKAIDIIYDFLVRKEKLKGIKTEDFYKTKTNKLFLIETSEYAGNSTVELAKEGMVMGSHLANNKIFLYLEDDTFPKEYSLILKKIEVLTLAYALGFEPSEEEVDFTRVMYDIAQTYTAIKTLKKKGKEVDEFSVKKLIDVDDDRFKYISYLIESARTVYK